MWIKCRVWGWLLVKCGDFAAELPRILLIQRRIKFSVTWDLKHSYTSPVSPVVIDAKNLAILQKNSNNSENVCSVCSGNHSFEGCPITAEKKMCKLWRASRGKCPRFTLAHHVTHHVAINKMTYRDALLKICKYTKASQPTQQMVPPVQTVYSNSVQNLTTATPPMVDRVSIATQTEDDAKRVSANHNPAFY